MNCLFPLWDICHHWTRLDFVFFPDHNASCLKCCPANSSFIDEITWGHFCVHLNQIPSPECSASSFVTQLLFGLSTAVISAVLLCTLMLFECKNRSLFSPKRKLTVNIIKGQMVDPELASQSGQHDFGFGMKWSFKEWLTLRIWFNFGLRWIVSSVYCKSMESKCILGKLHFLRDCVQECKSWSGMESFWREKPTRRSKGSSDSRVMKQTCVSDCE